MSVLVKGMEMPRCCEECPFMHEGFMYGSLYPCVCHAKEARMLIKPSEVDMRDGICPLVEVPEKHGRLIDADKMNDLLRKERERAIGSGNKLVAFAVGFAMGFIHKEPTVIEGSEDA